MKDDFLKLTNTVYKVLEFFPESDPLKNRAKDKALAIMERLVLVQETSGWASFQKEKIKAQLLEDIDMLLGYLWIGKSQSWLNSVSYLIIAGEYEKVKREMGSIMEPIIPKRTQITPDPVLNKTGAKEGAPDSFKIIDEKKISDRQRKIIEFLSKNEKAQVMDLQTVLPDITKRTIRRDLDDLLEVGKIIRMGDFNQVFYQLKG